MDEQRTPTSRWIHNDDGSWTPDRDRGAALVEAAEEPTPPPGGLEQGDIVAGPGIIVTDNPDGTVTIASSGRGFSRYRWGGTTVADPGSGNVNVNGSGNQPRILAVHEVDADGINRSGALAVIQPGDFLILTDDPTAPPTTGFARYSVTGVPIDRGTWWEIPANRTDTTGSTNPPPVGTMLRLYGDLAGGSSGGGGGGGLTEGTWQFDSSTADSDPGDGQFRLNAATRAATTWLYFNDVNLEGLGISPAATHVKAGDEVIIQKFDAPNDFVRYEITGDSVDASGYWKFPVTPTEVSGGEFQNNKNAVAVWRIAHFGGGGGGEQGHPVITSDDWPPGPPHIEGTVYIKPGTGTEMLEADRLTNNQRWSWIGFGYSLPGGPFTPVAEGMKVDWGNPTTIGTSGQLATIFSRAPGLEQGVEYVFRATVNVPVGSPDLRLTHAFTQSTDWITQKGVDVTVAMVLRRNDLNPADGVGFEAPPGTVGGEFTIKAVSVQRVDEATPSVWYIWTGESWQQYPGQDGGLDEVIISATEPPTPSPGPYPRLWVDTAADAHLGRVKIVTTKFATPGSFTWTIPGDLLWAEVLVVGAGGAGGSAAAAPTGQAAVGGGGGGGAVSHLRLTKDDLAAAGHTTSVPIVVGTAGVAVAGSAGGNGGLSSFGGMVCNGGNGGGTIAPGTTVGGTAGGVGGSATHDGSFTNEASYGGGGGHPGLRYAANFVSAGAGGVSFGGNGRGASAWSGTLGGESGRGRGGGGGGATSVNGGSAQSGGAGAHGIVVIFEYWAA